MSALRAELAAASGLALALARRWGRHCAGAAGGGRNSRLEGLCLAARRRPEDPEQLARREAALKRREQVLTQSATGRWEQPSDVGDPWAQNAQGNWSLPKPRLPHKKRREALTRRFDRLATATGANADPPPWSGEQGSTTKLQTPISRAGALANQVRLDKLTARKEHLSRVARSGAVDPAAQGTPRSMPGAAALDTGGPGIRRGQEATPRSAMYQEGSRAAAARDWGGPGSPEGRQHEVGGLGAGALERATQALDSSPQLEKIRQRNARRRANLEARERLLKQQEASQQQGAAAQRGPA